MSTSPTLRPQTALPERDKPQEGGEPHAQFVHFPRRDAHDNGVARSSYNAARSAARQIIPLELGLEVRSLLAPEEVQLNYLRRVEDILPQPFGVQLEDILLVNDQEEEVVPARLRAVDDNYIIIQTLQPLTRCSRGTQLLVLLPISPQRLDALRATIHEIQSPTRFRLLCQDRRREVRRRVQLVAPVRLCLFPPEVKTALVQQQVRLVRDIALPVKTDQSTEHSYINDLLYTGDGTEPAACMRHLDESSPLLCRLHDMSPGGLAVTPPAEQQVGTLVNRLVLLQMALPYVACGVTKVYFTLQLFGLIRGSSENVSPQRLHLRFLHRLPEEMSVAFAHLERRYLQRQSPLE